MYEVNYGEGWEPTTKERTERAVKNAYIFPAIVLNCMINLGQAFRTGVGRYRWRASDEEEREQP